MREPTRPKLSGWCSGPVGCESGRAHATCQDRLDRQLLERCECPGHPESPAIQGETTQNKVESGEQSGPESALTDRGQRPLPTKAE